MNFFSKSWTSAPPGSECAWWPVLSRGDTLAPPWGETIISREQKRHEKGLAHLFGRDESLDLGVDARQFPLDRAHEQAGEPLHEEGGAHGLGEGRIGGVLREVGLLLGARVCHRPQLDDVLLRPVHDPLKIELQTQTQLRSRKR